MKNLHKRSKKSMKGIDDLAHDLRAALMTQQLQMVFQPKVCIKSQKTTGAEVLLRWQHPVEGLIPAERWVSIAESHNLMRPITLWLVDQVITYLKSKKKAALPLAINIPPTILDGALALHIANALSEANVSPDLLEVEITEAAPVDNLTNLANAARLLQTKGIKVYLDDFGTGYSTMKYLVAVPVDGVKMDKSFVQQAPLIPTARMVLASLIELAREIGVRVICEGVETLEQLSLVKKMGAQEIQGFLTGKPMSPEAFTKRVATHEINILPEVKETEYKVHAS